MGALIRSRYASGSVRQLKGKRLDQVAAGGPRDWASANQVPEERLTRLLIIEDALLAALRNANQGAYNGA